MKVELEQCKAQQMEGLIYIGLQFLRVLLLELRLKRQSLPGQDGEFFCFGTC